MVVAFKGYDLEADFKTQLGGFQVTIEQWGSKTT
jgi:hypothetical protein